MKHLVRYTVRPECAAENERLVCAVFAALRAERPAGLRYATFRLSDGVSFVHLVSHEAGEVGNALTSLPAFQAFAAGVKERCTVLPERTELTEIGAYGWFDR